ncbi:hypothetical protein [Deinococcus hopiensis]
MQVAAYEEAVNLFTAYTQRSEQQSGIGRL